MAAMQARFSTRTACISCRGTTLNELSSGRFDEGKVGDFLRADPWGEDPMPFLAGMPWSYVRCAGCDMAFHRHILDPEWNERRFSKWMSHSAISAFEKKVLTPTVLFDAGAAHASHILRIERLTRAQRGDESVRILDFGCGYGRFLSMCSLFGFDAVGVDRASARRDNAVFPILPDIDDVRGMSFHTVTLFEVLEHLDDPRSILQQLAGLLLPNGILVVETPDCEGVVGIESREDYLKIHPLEHINGFTWETMQRMVQDLGFVRIVPPAAYVTTSLKYVARHSVKEALRARMNRTQQYFRKTTDQPS